MDRKVYTLRVVSPMFSNGADPGALEVRATAVRGQLRYWLRAIIGAQNAELKHLWSKESEVFGTTEQGSRVAVRVYPIAVGSQYVKQSKILPHREHRPLPSLAIPPDWEVSLELVARKGALPERALHALHLWSLLGGLGKRSRRMFGAFKLSGGDAPRYNSPDELAEAIRKTLKDAGCQVNTSPDIPEFPTLHPKHSWIIVGRRGYDDYEDAVISLFRDLLRSPKFRPNQDSFGGIRPRRSSPLIAQLRQIGDKYYPVLTALRAKPDSKINWNVVRDFMEAATRHFDAEKVWGGW
ncbi:MAG: type III-B CRISPR module RAMP protein Cmr1 [Chloroflexi bacterium]|nr:type III-B CRISPR module RAMP protein Cmr1 [Chloroflexota bacterium]